MKIENVPQFLHTSVYKKNYNKNVRYEIPVYVAISIYVKFIDIFPFPPDGHFYTPSTSGWCWETNRIKARLKSANFFSSPMMIRLTVSNLLLLSLALLELELIRRHRRLRGLLLLKTCSRSRRRLNIRSVFTYSADLYSKIMMCNISKSRVDRR